MKESLEKTKERAEELASSLPARVYALVGNLGAGKTTFAQFFLRALGVKGPITSPTFVIIKKYILRPNPLPLIPNPYIYAYHIDCYRLHDPQELLVLGFADILADPHALVLIEWADKVRDLLPQDAIWLDFSRGRLTPMDKRI